MTAKTATERGAPEEAAAPVRMGRRERNKLEKRARIVAAARRLFDEQGFAETTTLQIAEAADIGTGTLFLYARSKEDLLVLVFKDEMMEVALDSFQKLPVGETLVEQALAVFARMIDYHARDIDLTRLLMREINMPAGGESQSAMDDLTGVIFDRFAALVEQARAAGQIEARFEPQQTARMIFAIYYFNLLRWLAGRIDREALLPQLRRELGILLALE
ncbi:MAG: TetR/AcrR family transcriptional regulator [Sphingomonadales bacterium]|nr:TetR/AcrR family transcriptional regulator [Sphingomonadales bacterium]